MRRITLALVTLALLLPLTACGGEDDTGSSVGDSRPFNDADVAFATDMVQHHAQALLMVDLTVQRDLDPELTDLAEQIRAAQGPEIETMVDWLEDWDQEIPETMRDHANAHGGGHDTEGMDDMPGMMSAEEMEELESLDGAAFEERWLVMMIEHHEGAIEMAETEVEDGEYADAVDLATQIVDSQQAEIDQMEQMLGS